MVLFRNDRRYASYLVHPSSFTRDKQVFLSWLDQVEYSEGGLSHNAIGEALAAALQVQAFFRLFTCQLMVHQAE